MALLHSINVSDGGVPKLPRQASKVMSNGVEGDRQRDLEHHGGPTRAVCLYSLELIRALQKEGHPIAVGSIGENLTLAGMPWEIMVPGEVIYVGEVTLELTAYAAPCSNLEPYFREGGFVRVAQKKHPGWSRLYARVLKEGTVRVGDWVRPQLTDADLAKDWPDLGAVAAELRSLGQTALAERLLDCVFTASTSGEIYADVGAALHEHRALRRKLSPGGSAAWDRALDRIDGLYGPVHLGDWVARRWRALWRRT